MSKWCCGCCRGTDLCCNRKITWPLVIGSSHVLIYLAVIIFNCYNLVMTILAAANRPDEVTVKKKEDVGAVVEEELEEEDSNVELVIAHTVSLLLLAFVGTVICINLLKASKQELEKHLRIWLVYTGLFCILTVPYYVWRLSTSQHVGRWLIQLVATNSFEGFFLGIAYSLITEIQAAESAKPMERDSSRFRCLQSRDSQITFVGDVTTLKNLTELKV